MLLNDLCLAPTKWTTTQESYINADIDAVHGRNSLQQAQITGLMETIFSVHRANEQPLRPLLNSTVGLCFLNFWWIWGAGEHRKNE